MPCGSRARLTGLLDDCFHRRPVWNGTGYGENMGVAMVMDYFLAKRALGGRRQRALREPGPAATSRSVPTVPTIPNFDHNPNSDGQLLPELPGHHERGLGPE